MVWVACFPTSTFRYIFNFIFGSNSVNSTDRGVTLGKLHPSMWEYVDNLSTLAVFFLYSTVVTDYFGSRFNLLVNNDTNEGSNQFRIVVNVFIIKLM